MGPDGVLIPGGMEEGRGLLTGLSRVVGWLDMALMVDFPTQTVL